MRSIFAWSPGFPGSIFYGQPGSAPGSRMAEREPAGDAHARPTATAMLAEIQVLPRPSGTADDPYKHVEAAISVLQESGLTWEVGALGTTIEGDPEAVWATLRRAHEACIAAGADGLVSVIKVAESAPARPQSTINSLTSKFRQGGEG